MRRAVVATLLGAYVAFFATITLGLFHRARAPVQLVPFATIRADCAMGGRAFVVNILGNLAVLVPFGILAAEALGRRASWWRVGLLAGGLSLAVEVGQYLTGARVADVDDVLMNTASGLIGYAAWRLARPRLTSQTDAG